MSGDLLAEMAAGSRARCERARAQRGFAALRQEALELPPPPALALHPDGFDLIAEVKLRSPSAGVLEAPEDAVPAVAARAVTYARAGAAAVSVLTEPSRFGGALAYLQAAASACKVPVMRKDFLVDPYQVWEARALGAGGVLFIARMLDDAVLAEMLETAREAGMFVLVEAFDGDDLERANALTADWPADGPPLLIGVNARDLATLDVLPSRVLLLRGLVGAHAIAVAESGLLEPSDAACVRATGYRMALVGTALMRAEDPGALVAEMLRAGRAA